MYIEDTVAPGENVEAALDALIEKRSVEEDAAGRDREELWRASCRSYHARRTAEFTAEWQRYYFNLAVEHQRLAAENSARARFLLELLREVRLDSVQGRGVYG
jgi:hypothetical protein